jgi:ATP-dependent helicase/nuclease subunit A
MAEELTIAQKPAVTDRGGNLLVSAAAGSGKTKVLTERLLSYIQDPVAPANIDDFLIITFTKAAAAELRVKIASKLTDAIADDPDNQHLQRQMQRLHMAHISTVDSFCTDLLREYAYRLDISSDFRMVDTTETPELQQRVLDQIMEKAYASLDSDPEFLALVNSQGFGRNDRAIPEIILKV